MTRRINHVVKYTGVGVLGMGRGREAGAAAKGKEENEKLPLSPLLPISPTPHLPFREVAEADKIFGNS
ncbi:hypothetical protein FACHB389_15320 [Nostoc calcicola FACHB-389]|nr:hypothetical protein FACHB389_15320 [Nostoc calcicola FACHB-389]